MCPRALFGVGGDWEHQDDKNNEVSHGDHISCGVNVVSFVKSQFGGSLTSFGGTFPM
jgi:hypothetical protein